MPRTRRRNPSPLLLAGGASAFLAMAVGAWMFGKKAALAQAAVEDEAARKARLLAPFANFSAQKPNLQQMAALASSGIRPFRSDTGASASSDEETSTSGGLSFRRGATT